MKEARQLLDELAVLGATIVPAGREQLILRAGRNAIPEALVRRVKDAKRDLLLELMVQVAEAPTAHVRRPVGQGPFGSRDLEAAVVRWLDEHPAPSAAGACAWCVQPESVNAVVVPFGTEPGTHVWLHSECWPAWSKARRAKALAALIGKGCDAEPR